MKLTSFCEELPPEGRLLIVEWSEIPSLGIRFGEIVHLFLGGNGIHHLVNLAVPYNDKTFKWSMTPQEELFDEKFARFNVSNRVIKHYGITHQLIKTTEELGECSSEIARSIPVLIRDGDLPDEQCEKLAGEIADCQFLFDQLGLRMGLQDRIDRIRLEKEKRQLKRIYEDEARNDD